jgi:hypothetical protein
VIFNKVAIEHNSIVPFSFWAPITQVQPINSNSWHPNRDLWIILKVTQRPSQKEVSETRWGKISAESSLFFHLCIIFYYEEE